VIITVVGETGIAYLEDGFSTSYCTSKNSVSEAFQPKIANSRQKGHENDIIVFKLKRVILREKPLNENKV
jgi:hypothetical protein